MPKTKLPTQDTEAYRSAFLDELPWLQSGEQTEHSTGEARAESSIMTQQMLVCLKE